MAFISTTTPAVSAIIEQENNNYCCQNPISNFIYSIFESISEFFSSLLASNASRENTGFNINQRVISFIEFAKEDFRRAPHSDSTCPITFLTCIKVPISGVSRSFHINLHARSANTLDIDASFENFKRRIIEALPTDSRNDQACPIEIKSCVITKMISTGNFNFSLYNHTLTGGGSCSPDSLTPQTLMQRISEFNEEYRTWLTAGFDVSTGNLVQLTNEEGERLESPIVLG